MSSFLFLRKMATVIILASPIYGIGTAFLNVPFTPRQLALAGSGMAFRGDPALFRLNPALMVQNQPATEVYFAYNSWLGGALGHSAVAVQPIKGGSLILGLRSLSITGLELRTSQPTDKPIANFMSSGTALEAGWGKAIGAIHWGGTIRWLQMESFTYSSSGFALDAGATFSFYQDRFVAGISLRNLGKMERFNDVAPELPRTVSAGIVLHPVRRPVALDLVTALSAEFSDWYGTIIRYGTEVSVGDLVISGGTNFYRGIRTFGGGVGIRARILTISYGFQLGSENLGMPHLLQIQLTLP